MSRQVLILYRNFDQNGETKQSCDRLPSTDSDRMSDSLMKRIVLTMLQQHSHSINLDSQAIAQAELDAYLEEQAQEIAPEIEIDSILDRDFGELYRVWHGSQILGTFYQAIDGLWIIQSNHAQIRCNTAVEAQLLIVATSGQLVSSAHQTDIDHLLDRPFDELTTSEWERLKQHAQAQVAGAA
ncbi:MAG: hypothetical protein DSM106950_37255 [Stigonema ocellatum SAG 48.90 = DSM 106950]|nr:hypothetical protein [Stigonema ocellatum SAG 48.90 = DSM 106950]